jgi:hypothetical protein
MVNKFCPKCNHIVITKRGDIDIFLLIILGIFTGGIGALIYLLVYFNQEPNRCINCNSICRENTTSPINSKKEKNKSSLQNEKQFHSKSIRINFCPNCGNKTSKSNYSNPNFCPYCGEELHVKYQIRSKIQCTICHIHINAGDKTIQCSYCGSKYHYSCVAEWLSSYNSCPMCQNQFIIPKAQLLKK